MPKWGRYEELRPRQAEVILAESPLAYLPWGSLEWHSYHNPIGLDALKVHHLAMMAAERTGGIVWPPIYAGYQTMKHRGFKHTIEVPAEVIMGLANACLDQCADEGFKLAVLIMGHYGGEHVKALKHVADNWPRIRGKGKDMKVWAFPEYQVRPEAYLPGDHAGAYETSLMMYFRPDLVNLLELPKEGNVLGTEAGFGIGGADPRKATEEYGTRLAEQIITAIVECVRARLDT